MSLRTCKTKRAPRRLPRSLFFLGSGFAVSLLDYKMQRSITPNSLPMSVQRTLTKSNLNMSLLLAKRNQPRLPEMWLRCGPVLTGFAARLRAALPVKVEGCRKT